MEEQIQLSNCRKPIRRGINIGFFTFTIALSFLVGYMSFRGYRDSIRHDYKVHLKGIIDFIVDKMDADNLEKCIRSHTTSKEYRELQVMLNMMTDNMDVMYISIIVPKNETAEDSALYVMDSESGQDITVSGEGSRFCILSGTDIPEQVAEDNMNAYMEEDVSYYIKDLPEGRHYTASMPVCNSEGERFALISAAADYDKLYNMSIRYAVLSIFLVVFIGVIFVLFFMRWISRNITIPIRMLEERALDFARKCDGQKSIDSIKFTAPEIHTDNEVESLTRSIKHMSMSMRGYIQEVLNAEKQFENAKEETEAMTRIAYQDALTKVKSKAAYNVELDSLKEKIDQNLAQFGVLMVDINNLKHINDTYGHEHGDEYIIGSCRIICDIYTHSSVYRIGGDEFVVILEGRDYDNRNELLHRLRERYEKTSYNDAVEPWYRYSAASGMAEYINGDNYDTVFKRADEAMYHNKESIKVRNEYEV